MNHKIAFVFIGCGAYARTYKCEMAIESLCKEAQWKGKIYLASDSPECYDIPKLRSDSGNDLIEMVQIPSFSNRFDSPFAITSRFPFIKTVPARKVIESKKLKSSLFELVEADIDIAVYCDSDLLFTRKDLTEKIIDFATKWSGDKAIKMSRSKKSNELHSGLFIAHRHHSKEMLQLWKTNMMNASLWAKDPYDRTKLEKAVSDSSKESPFIVEQLPDYAEKFYSPGKELAFATHISIARILNNEHQKLIDFIADLELKSCSAENYISPKMSKIKRYLLYLSYLPFKKEGKIEA